jgi:hypothetical protein
VKWNQAKSPMGDSFSSGLIMGKNVRISENTSKIRGNLKNWSKVAPSYGTAVSNWAPVLVRLESGLPGHNTAYSDRWLPTLRWNLLPPFSG